MSMRSRGLAAAFAALLALLFLAVTPAHAAPGKPGPAGSSSPAADAGYRASAVPSASAAALTAIQARVADYVAHNGTRYSFADYVDPGTGQVVLETDAPAGVVDSVTNLSGTAAASTAEAAARTVVRRATTTDAFNRRDDTPAFWGGGGITNKTAISGGFFLCSTGFAVTLPTGVARMVTAGHCFPNTMVVLTESRAHTEGKVSKRHLDSINHDGKDMELIGGQSYAGRVFTGGVTSTTSKPVHGAGSAVVGFNNYCHSGRTTGEQCGHTANSTNAQVCTETGCKSPVISYTGGVIQQGGDSGGMFYALSGDGTSVFVRGHVIAGNSSTGFIEPWTVTQSTYSATIVTG
jgi:hypothetical protein